MSAWLSGLPLIGYGMTVTYLLRRNVRGVFALVLSTGGLVALAALAALMTTLSTSPVASPAPSPLAPLVGVAMAAAASSVGAATAVTATGPGAGAGVTVARRRPPGLAGRTLLVVALSEGLAIYGLVVGGLLLWAT